MSDSVRSETTRRAALASLAGLTATSAGCLDRLRNIRGHDRPEQLSLTVKAVSSDADPFAIDVARTLASNLRTVGVAARVTPVTVEELHRQVLINTDFDLYVGQFPATGGVDPDELYPFLHSTFTSEPGWQNPFGYTSLDLDELLDRQRQSSGERRARTVTEIQHHVAREVPFQVLVFPDHLTALRASSVADWNTASGVRSSVGLLETELTGTGSGAAETGSGEIAFRLATADPRITENRNPLAVEFRENGALTGLLYDPLARRYGDAGDLGPWLARDWSWSGDDDAATATVTLREGLAWHDGESLTAADVAFTYRLLADTSLGEQESPVPAPRFRGRSSLVEAAEAVDDRTVELRFATGNRNVARRALTVPVLPEHVWRDRTDEASVVGLGFDGVTEAIVWGNPDPVGSGPMQFGSATAGESLVLERNPDHFLSRESPAGIPSSLRGKPAFDRLVVSRTTADVSAVELVAGGDADATLSNLGSDTVPRIGRDDSLRLTANRSSAFYHVGFNTRRAPLSNPRFRQAVAALLDQAHLASETFDGYATPAATPLAGTDWAADDLEWSDGDPVTPFAGTDGELDAERARDAFRDAGYQYDGNVRLVDR
ncbi:ABC transporter substrate-binding protein [Halorussus halobius]|uniref:ABC transporter substrate-binding protein n=1 Tax=Halorussus halobius TaxID=1710537 RepID=UPI0010929376|nr:ABC transporter substrate-binding protein [Halorussus halobius]